jgi:hypothetical protein
MLLTFFGDRGLADAAESHIGNLLGCMVYAAWVTCDGDAVSRASLGARLTFAFPRDRIVEARSRLV